MSPLPPGRAGICISKSLIGFNIILLSFLNLVISFCRISPSTSDYVQKIASEQAAIESLLGIENLRTQLEQTSIADEGMNVDVNIPPPMQVPSTHYPQPISAKLAALEMWVGGSFSEYCPAFY